MKLLILRIFRFSFLFVIAVLTFQVIVALSTNFFPYIESFTFGCTDIKGGSYERTIEFSNWNSTSDARKKGIILGPSTAYRNVDPTILDSITNINWFNFGNSTQTPNVSVTLLKQILSKNQAPSERINFIVIDLFKPFIEHRGDESCYDLIINSTLSSTQKIELFLEAPSFKLFDQLIYRTLKSNIPHKIYRNEAQRGEAYLSKGFVCSASSERTISYSDFDSSDQHLSLTKDLEELIKLCRDNQISLIFNLCPVLNKKTINHIEGQHVIINDEFNQRSELFYDSHHMTCSGAAIYSLSLANKLNTIIASQNSN